MKIEDFNTWQDAEDEVNDAIDDSIENDDFEDQSNDDFEIRINL